MDDAKPAPAGGQPWARELVKQGDKHCIANQKLRLQTQDALKLQRAEPVPHAVAVRAPRARARGSSSDRVPDLPRRPVPGRADRRPLRREPQVPERATRTSASTLQNGVHADSLGPTTITRWAEFLKLYVANEIPVVPDSVLSLSGALYAASPTRRRGTRCCSRASPGMTNVAAAKAIFKRDPRVRVLMDNGAGPQGPGSIGATWELGFSAWPPKEARPTRYFLGPSGALGAKPGEARSTAAYIADPKRAPAPDAAGRRRRGRLEGPAALRLGAGRGRQGPRLHHARRSRKDVVIAGPSSLDLYLKSSRPDTDLQVTLSEVRPDGNETYVQNGWLRASHRKLDPALSTRARSVPDPPEVGRRAAARRARSRSCGCRSSPSPTPSAPGSRIRVTITGHGRRPAALGLRDRRQGQRAQHDLARRGARVEPGAAGRRRRHRQGHAAARRRPRCAASPTASTRRPRTAAERQAARVRARGFATSTSSSPG